VLPSGSEIVHALGAGDDLVGRSAECDYPPEVRRLPVVMRARHEDRDRPSAEIDGRVQSARSHQESLYELDVPLLARLRPEVLITQDLCGVCSVTEDEVTDACRAAGVSPTIVSLSPRTLDDVWASIEIVASAIGRDQEGARLSGALRARSAPAGPQGAGRVAVVEWLDPPILAGLWTPCMVAAAGGTPVGPAAGEVGLRTTWDGISRLDPALVILSPCSFGVERTQAEIRRLPLARAMNAALSNRSAHIADEAYFSRPGPRLADGIDLLRGLLERRNGPYPLPVAPLTAVAGG